MKTTTETTTKRPIHEIIRDIRKHWKPVHYTARPYLDILSGATDGNEMVSWCETARHNINYLLGNMSQFKGEDARRLKAELKLHLK